MNSFASLAKKGLSGVKTAAKVTAAALTAVSGGLIAAGGYAVSVGSNFEEGMSKVEAICGASADEIGRLTEKAKEMGAKTKFSATESAAAFQYMAMAGWKTEDMLDGIEAVSYTHLTVPADHYRMVQIWESWYRNKVRGFHSYRINNGAKTVKCDRLSAGMAKMVSEDLADDLLNEKVMITLSDQA